VPGRGGDGEGINGEELGPFTFSRVEPGYRCHLPDGTELQNLRQTLARGPDSYKLYADACATTPLSAIPTTEVVTGGVRILAHEHGVYDGPHGTVPVLEVPPDGRRETWCRIVPADSKDLRGDILVNVQANGSRRTVVLALFDPTATVQPYTYAGPAVVRRTESAAGVRYDANYDFTLFVEPHPSAANGFDYRGRLATQVNAVRLSVDVLCRMPR
jgi:hypothetical protein